MSDQSEINSFTKDLTLNELSQLADQASSEDTLQKEGLQRLDRNEIQTASEMLSNKLSERNSLTQEEVVHDALDKIRDEITETAEYLLAVLDRHGISVQVLENRRKPVSGA